MAAILNLTTGIVYLQSWAGLVVGGSLTLTTPLAATSGGTGFASYTIGDLLAADTATSLSKIIDVAVGQVLTSGGAAVLPLWSASPVVTAVYGGTTNATTLTLSGTSNASPLTTAYLLLNSLGGFVGIGTTAPAGTLHINRPSGSTPTFFLTEGGLAQPITARASATTFGKLLANDVTQGGLQIEGFSGRNDQSGIYMLARVGGTVPSVAAFNLTAYKSDGATDQTALANGEIAFQVSNNGTNPVTIMGSGNVGLGGTAPLALLSVGGNGSASFTADVTGTLHASGIVTEGGPLNLITTSTDGEILQNTTASTAGVPVQISPRLRFRSNVWNTTAVAANNTDDFFIESAPVSGLTPSGLLKFGSSLNGAGATYPFTVSSAGAGTFLAGLIATTGVFSGAVSSTAITSTSTPIPVTSGGTGLAIGSSGGVLGFTSTTALASTGTLAVGTLIVGGGSGAVPGSVLAVATGQILISQGLITNPAYSAAPVLGVAASQAGTIGLAKGVGGGNIWTLASAATSAWTMTSAAVAPAQGDLLVFTNATGQMGSVVDVAVGSYLRSGGASAVPVYSTTTLPNTVATGNILIASATNVVSAITPASANVQPADQTGNATGTLKMNGLGAAAAPTLLTPVYSGRVAVTICGELTNSIVLDGVQYILVYGSGAPPANAASASGTAISATRTAAVSTAAQKQGFSVTAQVTGLTITTAYWFDLQISNITGGTASVSNITFSAHEF